MSIITEALYDVEMLNWSEQNPETVLILYQIYVANSKYELGNPLLKI